MISKTKEADVSSEWTNTTTLQVKAERRDQLEQLQLKLQAQEGRRIDLREMADRALVAGIASLALSAMTSMPRSVEEM